MWNQAVSGEQWTMFTSERRNARPLGAADWLGLAAAPTFGAMALLAIFGGVPELCAVTSPLDGMAPMYVLMSAFHMALWLRLIAGGRN